MISAEMAGRLGNQMFIIAAATSLAIDNNDFAVFPDFISGISPTKKETKLHRDTILRNLTFADTLPEMKFYYEPADLSYKKIIYEENLYLRGYFQSEKYFKHNREQILKLFSPQNQIKTYICKKYEALIDNEDYVSIHVRRGDYLKLSEFHAVLGKEYYDKAMDKYHGANFVFFSDDIEWCRQTFKGKNFIFIEKQPDVIDIFLMSKICHNIIANSSFSWWGAWLNQIDAQTVVAPLRWFGIKNSHLQRKDLTPDSWETIKDG
tara:strand:- start:24 stop:812 length:789 start_codon:yes stop_codon:yes gene_type:complete